MESFRRITAIAAPLPQANVDTDQIVPTRFLARLSEDGIGDGLFAEWRLHPDGTPNKEFVLNRPPWDRAQILVAGPNFGCGSSREAAPRALRQRGFRALIAPSFGDIFFSNCFRNGIVPVRLPRAVVERLFDGGELTVDLETGHVEVTATGESWPFETPPRLRRMLLDGLDEIALTETMAEDIRAFRALDRVSRPWAYG